MEKRIIIPGAIAILLLSCSSEHNLHDAAGEPEADLMTDPSQEEEAEGAGDPGEAEDGSEDAGEEPWEPTVSSCAAQDGVTVEGTAFFDGEFPALSRFWITWQLDPPMIPQCILEVTPIVFPAPYRFTGVPKDQPWHIEAVLDVSGGFPPIPAEGDFVATVPASDLDLTRDVSGLDLHLLPYTP